MNAPKTFYYKSKEIPTEFLRDEITRMRKEWGCCPARTLSDICDSIVRNWAKKQNDPTPWMARIQATSYIKSDWSVYSVFRCIEVERMLEECNFGRIEHNGYLYFYRRGITSIKSVEHWFNDNFRGTMENPF